jgi:hypothetical protein
MHPVEFFIWLLPPDPERIGATPRRSGWRMSRDYAERHYPGVTCIESSRQVIWCPDGPEEFLHFNWVNTGAPGKTE